MNLFNKSDTIDNKDNKWKDQYFKLLDEQELIQKTRQDEQELLCKTIIRLCLATKGLDKQLDPHLQKIRTHLKSGVNSLALRTALDEFNDALLKIEDAHQKPQQEDTSLLFGFLYQFFPNQKQSLQVLQNKYDHFEFSSGQDLLMALSKITEGLPADFGMTNENDTPEAFSKVSDIDIVVSQLLELLNAAEIPSEFDERAALLKERLKPGVSFIALKIIMNDYIDLLHAIKRRQQLEQKEMATFLSNLTEQLNELGLTATGASVATQIAAKNRNLLDQSVSAQMSDLQKSSAVATTLEPLKQLINTRLHSIAQEIQVHTKNEELQRQETEQQLNELTNRINILDAESKELKNKLVIAHSKATRDPLTGLPNRLAYDENVSIEVSRWKRYQTPLTMIIWDIDLFKKINDTYGHKAGDKTLTIIANLLSEYCRETDFVARLGGEEFIMLLPNTDCSSALIVANKLRTIIANTGFNSGGNRIRITISCGISQFLEDDSNESVFERADKALYQAKEGGRNQCVLN